MLNKSKIAWSFAVVLGAALPVATQAFAESNYIDWGPSRAEESASLQAGGKEAYSLSTSQASQESPQAAVAREHKKPHQH
jgi:hypothetical protein